MSESQKRLKYFIKPPAFGTVFALSLSLSLSLKTHLNLFKKICLKPLRPLPPKTMRMEKGEIKRGDAGKV
jgi:hypothetical protein